jgi:hypothetical protein
MLLRLAVVLALFVTGFAQASMDQKASAFVLCKNKKDVRTLRVLPDMDKKDNCKITYSKGASEETVGSNHSISQCKSILKNIQTTLESSNWSCRNVQSASIVTSSEMVRQ